MREKGDGGVGVSSQAGYLIGVLETAAEVWRLAVPVQVAKDVRRALTKLGIVRKSKTRDRRVLDTEAARVVGQIERKATAIPIGDVVWFCIASAMRISEVCRLQWDDLNETDRTIRIRDRKHPTQKIGNHQIVPLLTVAGHDAYAIVARQPRKNKRIFPVNAKTVGSYFTEAVSQLEISDLHLHDLRHEAISRLFEAGYRIEQVSIVSGHRDWSMLKRYTHLRAVDLHRAPTP
jgi:integrase